MVMVEVAVAVVTDQPPPAAPHRPTPNREPQMRRLLLLLSALSLPLCAASAELDAADSGIYVVVGRDGQLSALSYRFFLEQGSWRAEGKDGQGPWKSLSCDRGCDYVNATPEQAESYLPSAMRQRFSIACIQNAAQAFCRYAERANPSQGGYVVLALVTDPPTPILVRRQR
jgi:hypothetical protein